MKKISLMTVVAITVLFIVAVPAVSAEVVIDELFSDFVDTSGNVSFQSDQTAYRKSFDSFILNHIEKHPYLHYVGVTTSGNLNYAAEGKHAITYSIQGGKTGTGVMYVDYNRNLLGNVVSSRFTIFLYEWDVGQLTGRKRITLSLPFASDLGANGDREVSTSIVGDICSATQYTNALKTSTEHKFTVVSSIQFQNRLIVERDTNLYTVKLIRNFDAAYASAISLMKGTTTIHRDYSTRDVELYAPIGEIDGIKIEKPTGDEVLRSLSGPPGDPDPDPTDPTVTIYIKNSQTGALIADANIVIEALVNGEYYTVANRTEPSGIFSITLQTTGGGQPNPDGYRLMVTADGYNNPMPEINFTVDDSKKYIYCLLDPIAGGPENENKTFIDFFVRDMSANPISGATVKFGIYTLITNSQGYTVFEVDKSNPYTYTISKSGYAHLTGNVVIGDAPRHTINTVLAPAVTPTKPTPIPTSTSIKPSPTMTSPTGEPVSNWLEWFAAHFGMILGGGAEIGKIFMWLCFSVPVGVYVGKESKAGAAGFMAGAGIVTLFFVLIGWVPIWLLVLLALIIGLLYAKVFNNSDTGGGR